MDLLAGASFGRVGVSVHALPAILPVNMAVIGELVVVPHDSGHEAGLRGDGLDPGRRGRLRTTPSRDRAGAFSCVESRPSWLTPRRSSGLGSCLAGSWIDERAAEHYIGVSCDLVTGRRLSPTDAYGAPGGGNLEPAVEEGP